MSVSWPETMFVLAEMARFRLRVSEVLTFVIVDQVDFCVECEDQELRLGKKG